MQPMVESKQASAQNIPDAEARDLKLGLQLIRVN